MNSTLQVLLLVALRNVVQRKVVSAIVGAIIAAGTFLMVLGTSVLDSMDRSMAASIVSSLAGHLQVYSDQAQDELALFGSGVMGDQEIGSVDNFGALRRRLEAVDNVKAVVPMGLHMTWVSWGNPIDDVVDRLRRARAQNIPHKSEEALGQLRLISEQLLPELDRRRAIIADAAKLDTQLSHLHRVLAPEFDTELETDSEAALMFVETKVAPLSEEGELLYLRNLGTDPQRFARHFNRFEVVEGQLIPEGQRGFMFAKRVYERYVKNKAARELDALYKGVVEQGNSIATDPLLKGKARRLPKQFRRITFDLNPADAKHLQERLQPMFPDVGDDLQRLVQAFLNVNDDNVGQRHKVFYDLIAPKIRLYRVNIGDTLTLRGYTKSGYIKSVNVKVYGVYQFKSLERSELAGAQNLIDLVTFRELYGSMSSAQKQELAGIKADVGREAVARDAAEAALFGGGTLEQEVEDAEAFDEFAGLELDNRQIDFFDGSAIDDGLTLSAAVVLRDAQRLPQTRAELERINVDEELGLKVVDWRSAAGLVGQFITVIRIVLYVAIFIVFLVALAVINNSMVMATLDRTAEIGTMRALGAQRSFVARLFMLETLVLGFVGGTLGALVGVWTVGWLADVGIPATSDIMVFLFSGPRLHPVFGSANLVIPMAVILVVTVLSTFYPTRIATRIQPIVAMQTRT